MSGQVDPGDLRGRLALGYSQLLNQLDLDDHHYPYFCGAASPTFTGSFSHVGFGNTEHDHDDISHNIGRVIDALLHAESILGLRVPDDVLNDLRGHLFSSLDNDACVPAWVDVSDGKTTSSPHDPREAMNSLSWLIRSRGDDEARNALAAMLRTLDEIVLPDGMFDEEAISRYDTLKRNPRWSNDFVADGCMHKHGRWTPGLMKVYEATGDPLALDLAQRVIRLARTHAFTPDGGILQTAGGHVHSLTGGLHGMAFYGRVAGDAEVLEHCVRIFEKGIPPLGSSFGWSLENYWNRHIIDRGEINNTGDMIQAALNLGSAGYKQFFQVAEQYIRSALIPCQQIGTENLPANPNPKSDSERDVPKRILGGWGMSRPNDRRWDPIIDLTCGAVQALCETFNWFVTLDALGVRVNLLFDYSNDRVSVKSGLPEVGRLEIAVHKDSPLLVRIPDWTPRTSVRVAVNGNSVSPTCVGNYALLPMAVSGSVVSVEFDVPRRRATEPINHFNYEVEFVGDVVVAMSPSSMREPNHMYAVIQGAAPAPKNPTVQE